MLKSEQNTHTFSEWVSYLFQLGFEWCIWNSTHSIFPKHYDTWFFCTVEMLSPPKLKSTCVLWKTPNDLILIYIAHKLLKPRSHCADLEVPISTIWKNRRERHGWFMKSWQHRTDILEVCSVGKQSAVIGKPVRQNFTLKLCRVGRDCGYDLFMDRFQSCVESETSWDCRSHRVGIRGQRVGIRGQRVGIRGQRVGIRGQRMDGHEDRINYKLSNWCDVFIYFKMCIYIYMFIF